MHKYSAFLMVDSPVVSFFSYQSITHFPLPRHHTPTLFVLSKCLVDGDWIENKREKGSGSFFLLLQ